MLTKPQSGWSDFSLVGSKRYSINNVNDLAFDWLDAAIQGLKAKYPFCVKGFLEPNRLLCVVSYNNCHILVEDERKEVNYQVHNTIDFSHTSMLDFCKFLYNDISTSFSEWLNFKNTSLTYDKEYVKAKRKQLRYKLAQLDKLIHERENEVDTLNSLY